MAPEDREPGLTWTKRSEIIVAGSAGQRVRSACGVLGELVTRGGSFAAQLDDFPITVRKGFSVSHLVLSQHAIRYAAVDKPDLIVLLSAEGYSRIRHLSWNHDCTVYAEESVTLDPNVPHVHRFSIRDVEHSAGKNGAALAVLFRALIEQQWVDPARLRTAALAHLRGAHREQQLRAIAWAIDPAGSATGDVE